MPISVEGLNLPLRGAKGWDVPFKAAITELVESVNAQELATADAIDVISGAVDTNDAAVAATVTSGVATTAALNSTIATVAGATDAVTDGKLLTKIGTGTERTIVATGHSLFYGQDAAGSNPPINGSVHNRSDAPTTSALASQADSMSFAGVVLVNQTYPGDRTAEALTRWAGGESGDVEFFWIDVNDANDYATNGGPLTEAETATNMAALAKRARDRGAPFIVIGGAPVQSSTNSFKLFASAEAERVVCERLGGTYVDAGELLAGDLAGTGSYWTDGVHMVPAAYDLIGARLAGLLGVKGVRPPRVSPGRIFTWRDQVWAGPLTIATVATPNYAGSVARLGSLTNLGFPFWAEVPVVPLVRVRAGASEAVIGLYTNRTLNRTPVYATIEAHDGETVAIVGRPTMSPGPSGLVIRAESGTIDVLSVEFLPITDPRSWASSSVEIGPVGGRGTRADAAWDAVVAWDSGSPLRSGQAQAGVVSRRFLFDARLGSLDSGVFLASSISSTVVTLARNGVILLRNGSDLKARRVINGSVTETVIAATFAASGLVSASIEAAFNGTDLAIYVDGVLKHTFLGFSEKYVHAGLIAGANSGHSFAAGRVTWN